MLDDVIASGSSSSAAPGTASGVAGSRARPGGSQALPAPRPASCVPRCPLCSPLLGSLIPSSWGEGVRVPGAPGSASSSRPVLRRTGRGGSCTLLPQAPLGGPSFSLRASNGPAAQPPAARSHPRSSPGSHRSIIRAANLAHLLLSEGETLIQASGMRGAERGRICFKNVTMNN